MEQRLSCKECETLAATLGFPVKEAWFREKNGETTLLVYRDVPDELRGLVEDTYIF